SKRDWSSDVCSSDLKMDLQAMLEASGSGVEVNLEDMDESLKTTLTDSMKEEMSKSIASELGIAEDAVSADASIDGNVMNISMSKIGRASCRERGKIQ